VLARKQPIPDYGLFHEALRNSHDFDLWVRLAKQGAHIAYQRKVLLQYRCHDNRLSGDAINNVVRQLRVYDKIDRCYDLSPEERADVSHMLENLRAELELETGKMHLTQGNFTGARNAFKEANKHYRKAKLTLAILLSEFITPAPFLPIYFDIKEVMHLISISWIVFRLGKGAPKDPHVLKRSRVTNKARLTPTSLPV
jgi:hypothetical protein